MDKPTIFFSHSSKDKEIVLSIKNRVTEITKGTLDIFMSSDGQSIPFGSNWIHKVEEGLKTSNIMFVFVTDNSLSSGWIYFEAGFAYNKNIHVVPVGLGVDVGSLKPPLNLLQGFNVSSAESLNNIISIINKEFETSYDDLFSEDDYLSLLQLISFEKDTSGAIVDFINRIVLSIEGTHYENGEKIVFEVEPVFNSILSYLNNNEIAYASEIGEHRKRLLFHGIEVIYEGEDYKPELGYLSIRLSCYSFVDCFSLLVKMFEQIDGLDHCCLYYYISDYYDCLESNEDISSIITYSENFNMSESLYGWYSHKDDSCQIQIIRAVYKLKDGSIRNSSHIVIDSPMKIEMSHVILSILSELLDMGIIFKKVSGMEI